ncbi:hypothetical protein Tco_0576373 [Tanacetum coccineum]
MRLASRLIDLLRRLYADLANFQNMVSGQECKFSTIKSPMRDTIRGTYVIGAEVINPHMLRNVGRRNDLGRFWSGWSFIIWNRLQPVGEEEDLDHHVVTYETYPFSQENHHSLSGEVISFITSSNKSLKCVLEEETVEHLNAASLHFSQTALLIFEADPKLQRGGMGVVVVVVVAVKIGV